MRFLSLRHGPQVQDLDRCALQLAANLHLFQPTIDVIVVHVEVMALERMTIHTSVDRVQVSIFTVVMLIEMHDHLESGDVSRMEHDIFAVGTYLC